MGEKASGGGGRKGRSGGGGGGGLSEASQLTFSAYKPQVDAAIKDIEAGKISKREAIDTYRNELAKVRSMIRAGDKSDRTLGKEAVAKYAIKAAQNAKAPLGRRISGRRGTSGSGRKW